MTIGSINYRNATKLALVNNLQVKRPPLDFTIFGDPQLSTDSKYGQNSLNFDSNGDYIEVTNPQLLKLETAAFTIEFWIKFNSLTSPAIQYLFDYRNVSTAAVMSMYYDQVNSRIAYQTGNTVRISKVHTFNTTDWFHVALTRNGTTFRLFVDGQAGGTHTNSGNISVSNPLTIGRGIISSAQMFNGKLDEFRVTLGESKYNAAFTPPTGPLENDPGTIILMNFENGIKDYTYGA
jgi:hypothetical protein